MVSLGFNHQHNHPKPPSSTSLEGSQHHHFSTFGVEDFAACHTVQRLLALAVKRFLVLSVGVIALFLGCSSILS